MKLRYHVTDPLGQSCENGTEPYGDLLLAHERESQLTHYARGPGPGLVHIVLAPSNILGRRGYYK